MENSAIKSGSHKPLTPAIENYLEAILTPAIENYLEAIFNLAKEKRVVRVKDIAKRLGVKMPTVTNMLKTLSARGLIEMGLMLVKKLTGDIMSCEAFLRIS